MSVPPATPRNRLPFKENFDMTGMNRRTFGKLLLGTAAVTAPMSFVRNAWSAGKEIQIGIWGGAQGEFVKKQIIPALTL